MLTQKTYRLFLRTDIAEPTGLADAAAIKAAIDAIALAVKTVQDKVF